MNYLKSWYEKACSFKDCLSQRFSKNRMTEPKCSICKLTKYNCGIVLIAIIIIITLTF
jgi:hypothetical protein